MALWGSFVWGVSRRSERAVRGRGACEQFSAKFSYQDERATGATDR